MEERKQTRKERDHSKEMEKKKRKNKKFFGDVLDERTSLPIPLY
jgi:hypothetical protein